MGGILFLAHRVPYPPDRGDKIRSWHILKRLCEIAHVHVVALCDDNRDMAHLRFINRHAKTVAVFPRHMPRDEAMLKALLRGGPASVHAFANRDMATYVKDILNEQNISTIFAFSGQMAQYVPLDAAGRRFVMDFVDMDSAKYAAWGANGTGLMARANRFEAKRLFAFEHSTAQRADVSLFVSDAEATLFRTESGLDDQKVQVLENGIDLSKYAPNLATNVQPGMVVFTGQMDYAPNVEAVIGFVRDVWPLVRAELPGAQFFIVGRNPTPEVKALATQDVTITGEVPDTRPYLAEAAVVVAPLALARGVQNKILEAMAMGKTVIASAAAAEGITARAGRDLVVVDDAKAQAAAVVHLLNSPYDAAQIGAMARRQMELRYGWDAQLARLPELVGLS